MSTYNYSTYDDLTSLFTDLGNRLRSKPTAVELTQAQYNALTPAEKADTSKIYMITDQGGGGGTGLLPYFYIDSEPGSTVTVTAPDGSTIVPTAEGSGHWECEVTMYGTYVIHSVLAGQGDATISVAVDTVKEYHITDNHFDFTINVTAPNNSTIRITSGTEIYTGTGTGSLQAFAVHQASATYSVTVTMDGNSKSQNVTSSTTTGQSTSVSFEFGTITVTVDPDFISAGSTITCTKGGTSCTPKSAASTVTFRVPETGIWVVASEISGQPYSKDAVVSSLATPVAVTLQTVPDGSTVTPTDNIQLWLNCAGIYDKTSYTTLEEVLGDKETLQILISDNNAVDYMVRSKSWIKQVSVPTMTSNTAPSGTASASSVHSDSVLGCQAWNAFDENVNKCWHESTGASTSDPHWLQYEFEEPVKMLAAEMAPLVYGTSPNLRSRIKTYKYQGSNDGFVSDINDLTEELTALDQSSGIAMTQTYCYVGVSNYEVFTKNVGAYKYYRLVMLDTYASGYAYAVCNLQFYSIPNTDHGITEDLTAMRYIGKRNYAANTLLADVNPGLVPIASANTSKILVSSERNTNLQAWHAFDGNWSKSMRYSDSGNNHWYANDYQNQYIGYDFDISVGIRYFKIRGFIDDSYGYYGLNHCKIQYSDDNNTWYDATSQFAVSTSQEYEGDISSSIGAHRYWRLFVVDSTSGNEYCGVSNLQFYAKPVEPQWGDGIYESDYMESVLNIKNPIMTSDTTPSGVCSASTIWSGYDAYKAFDGNDSTCWHTAASTTSGWLQYKFTSAVKILMAKGYDDQSRFTSYKFEGSVDGSTWFDLTETFTTPIGSGEKKFRFTKNVDNYLYYRLTVNTATTQPSICELKFYGREDVDESYIDVYSAASDNDIHYMSGSTPVTVASTDPNGKGSVSRSLLPNGDYDLYSSVAMDPNGDLSTEYYHKKVKVTNSTIEIMLMPDGDILYWYGYKSDELEHCSSGNGWTTSISGASVSDTTTDTTNYFNKPTTSQAIGGRGTKNKKHSNALLGIIEGTQAYSNNACTIAALNTKVLGGPSASAVAWDAVESVGIKKLHANLSNLDGEYYLAAYSYHTSSFKAYALWSIKHNPAANFFSAANDIVYYMSSGVQVVVAETNELGEALVNLANIPTGVTLYSSVAKDPDSLATTPTDFSKVFNGPDANGKFYLMPNNSIYWYGYMIEDSEIINTANGWTLSNGFVDPTFNANSISCVLGSSGGVSGISSSSIITQTTIHGITKGVKSAGASNSYGLIGEATTKSPLNVSTPTSLLNGTLAKNDHTMVNNGYVWIGAVNTRATEVYALWYD